MLSPLQFSARLKERQARYDPSGGGFRGSYPKERAVHGPYSDDPSKEQGPSPTWKMKGF